MRFNGERGARVVQIIDTGMGADGKRHPGRLTVPASDNRSLRIRLSLRAEEHGIEGGIVQSIVSAEI